MAYGRHPAPPQGLAEARLSPFIMLGSLYPNTARFCAHLHAYYLACKLQQRILKKRKLFIAWGSCILIPRIAVGRYRNDHGLALIIGMLPRQDILGNQNKYNISLLKSQHFLTEILRKFPGEGLDADLRALITVEFCVGESDGARVKTTARPGLHSGYTRFRRIPGIRL
jgi:hypothetical protein